MNGSKNVARKKQKLLMHVEAEGPIVASFPGGLPATEAKFVWKKQNGSRFLVGKDEACRYYGKEEPSRSRLMIALYDKQNHTVTCHLAAADGRVFPLQQKVTGYKSSTATTGGDEETTNVYQEFGSSKKKRALQSQQANRIHADQILGTSGTLAKLVVENEDMTDSNRQAIQQQHDRRNSLEQTAPAVPGVSLAAQDATDAWRKSFLPNHSDPNADTPSKVYRPELMAGPACWSQAIRVTDACFHDDDPAKALQKSKGGDSWQYTSIKNLLQRTKQQKSHYRALWLLNLWTGLFQKNQRRRFTEEGSGYPAVESFWQNFGTPIMSPQQKSGFCMSKANQDRCQLHLLLIYLWIEDCSSTSLQEYCAEMKWPWTQMVPLLQQAGCVVQKNKVYLKTPVSYPQSIRRGRRKS